MTSDANKIIDKVTRLYIIEVFQRLKLKIAGLGYQMFFQGMEDLFMKCLTNPLGQKNKINTLTFNKRSRFFLISLIPKFTIYLFLSPKVIANKPTPI
jgi:hypothetical protein